MQLGATEPAPPKEIKRKTGYLWQRCNFTAMKIKSAVEE